MATLVQPVDEVIEAGCGVGLAESTVDSSASSAESGHAIGDLRRGTLKIGWGDGEQVFGGELPQ